MSKKFKKSYQDLARPKALYMTYVLTFPDGDVWIKQRPIHSDIRWELKEMMKEHKKSGEWKARIMALWKAHECWWKDALGGEHLILIEEKKRAEKWGLSKKGLATIESGKTIEQVGATNV